MIIVEKDIGRDLQAYSDKSQDAFELMANIYIYVTGREPKRSRLKSNYVQPPKSPAGTKVAAARVKCDGNYDPEPGGLQQLRAVLAVKHAMDLEVSTLAPAFFFQAEDGIRAGRVTGVQTCALPI